VSAVRLGLSQIAGTTTRGSVSEVARIKQPAIVSVFGRLCVRVDQGGHSAQPSQKHVLERVGDVGSRQYRHEEQAPAKGASQSTGIAV